MRLVNPLSRVQDARTPSIRALVSGATRTYSHGINVRMPYRILAMKSIRKSGGEIVYR